ncbi:MAG: hypothetical protein R3E39_28220 [Anaerolineae bacterium]
MKAVVYVLLVAQVGFFMIGLFTQTGVVSETADMVIDNRTHIELRSNPYPLVVGSSQLFFTVLDANGHPLDAASLDVKIATSQGSSLPLQSSVIQTATGQFSVPVQWSTGGALTISANAVLTDGSVLDDSFAVYMYTATETAPPLPTQFRSARQNGALVTDPQHELAIIIPQGTLAMIQSGVIENAFPDEIRLSVSGLNTLIIRNNDIVNHEVGPFSIRAGETIRQKFTIPNFFQGSCTVTGTSLVSIIVEE